MTVTTIISDRARYLCWWHHLPQRAMEAMVNTFTVHHERAILVVLIRMQTGTKSAGIDCKLSETSSISFTFLSRNLNIVLERLSFVV